MTKLILIHGYARSGKSTLLKALQAAGYQTVSTSVELDHIVIERYCLPRTAIAVLQNKDDATLQQVMQKPNVTCRDIKITTAENWYIPRYGRLGLIKRAFANQYIPCNKDYVFFESIGGNEAKITKQVWKQYSGEEPISINLRSEWELTGVDIRELDPRGIDVWNEGNSPDKLLDTVFESIELLSKPIAIE